MAAAPPGGGGGGTEQVILALEDGEAAQKRAQETLERGYQEDLECPLAAQYQQMQKQIVLLAMK